MALVQVLILNIHIHLSVCVGRNGSKNFHQTNMYLEHIGLPSQNMLTILGSPINKIDKSYMIIKWKNNPHFENEQDNLMTSSHTFKDPLLLLATQYALNIPKNPTPHHHFCLSSPYYHQFVITIRDHVVKSVYIESTTKGLIVAHIILYSYLLLQGANVCIYEPMVIT